eukprot:13761157-Alexandrium_andersonii.AAC.1
MRRRWRPREYSAPCHFQSKTGCPWKVQRAAAPSQARPVGEDRSEGTPHGVRESDGRREAPTGTSPSPSRGGAENPPDALGVE